MSTNKHAYIRYQALDKCFSNPGRRYGIDDLIEACNKAIYEFSGIENGIKRRQLYDDIAFMESDMGWNIELEKYKDGRKVFYRYKDRNFSIKNQPVNEAEANQLKEALLTLNRFKGLPQFEWVDEIVTRLESSFDLIASDKQVIEFDQNMFLKGKEWITELYHGIVNEKVFEIRYQPFNATEPSNIIFHPYYLKQYNNRWFVFGWQSELNKIANLGLDRIENIEEKNFPYIQSEIDFTDYFDDVVGVTVYEDAPVEKIVLKIDNSLWPYIKTKPIHGSQKLLETNENYTVVQLNVQINYELISVLFSYGESIEILEPDILIDKIKHKIEKLKNNYI